MTGEDYVHDLWCQLADDQCNFEHFTLTTLQLTRYVCVDAAAIRALILLPPPVSGTANCHQNVLGHIVGCCISHGHRSLKRVTGHAVDLVLYLGWATGVLY